MAHGDGAAVDVDLVLTHAHVLHELHDDGGKRLVDLEQIDVFHRQPSLGQRLAGGRRRAGKHDGRVGAGHCGGDDARTGFQAQFLALGFGADQHQRRTIDDARAVARRVHVVDALNVGVLAQGRGVEAHLAHHLEAGLELAQALQRAVTTDKFVAVEDDDAVLIQHRHQGFLEGTIGAGAGGLLLRAQGKAVDVLAREAFEGGDQIRAHALWHEIGVHVGRRVHRPGAAIGAHGDARHGFHAADHHQVLEARTHLHGAEVHCLQTRGAETVELHARHGFIPVGHQRGGLGDIGALVAHRGHAAQDDIVDLAGIQRVALLQGLEQAGQQIDRLDAVQRTVLLALAARRAHGIENISFGHGVLSS